MIPVEPPPEIKDKLGEAWRGLKWFPYPSLIGYQERKGQIQEVDILEKTAWALADPRMRGVVMAIDAANGCLTQCDTCVRDTPKTSLSISRESWDEAWKTQSFIDFFDGRFRWGDCADPSDHKDVVERTTAMMNNCPKLFLEMLVNFRKYKKDRLAGLIDLLRKNERINLCISLPLHRNRKPQEDFLQFEREFLTTDNVNLIGYSGRRSGRINNMGGLEVNDLREPYNTVDWLGRIVAPRYYAGVKEILRDDPDDFCRRGNTYIYLNPEGFFIEVSVTPFQSYTGTVYTPLNERTIGLLQKLPLAQKGYFNWPGGSSVNSNFALLDHLMAEAAKTGTPFSPRIIE